MKIVWGPVRRIGHMYGLYLGNMWFIGVCKQYDLGVIYEYSGDM